jgi:diguanylate cyclase (GGDEF)-like protein
VSTPVSSPAPTPASTPAATTPPAVTVPPILPPAGHPTTSGKQAKNSASALASLGTAAGRRDLLASVLGIEASRHVAPLGAFVSALATATTAGTTGGHGSATAATGTGPGTTRGGAGHVVGAPKAQDGKITVVPVFVKQFIKAVPQAVWDVLAVAILLAAIGAGSALLMGRRVRRQAGAMAQATAEAMTDPLTGVLNRRGFTEAVERELNRAQRHGRPFVIAYGDVRGLKGVNDSEGHLAGDQLLKAVGELLTGCARAHDVAGRLGGDEFALLLTEQSAQNAPAVTQRIAEQVQAARESLGFTAAWGLTIGVAAFPADGETAEDLLATADRRLYEQRGIELAGAR